MSEYLYLKWANDPRWSNARKRDAQKMMAEIGEVAAETYAECQRSVKVAKARRLADAKQKVATLHQVANRSFLAPLLTGVSGADGRVAYEQMASVDMVEQSLRTKIARYKLWLTGCQTRVAEKTMRLVRLHSSMAHGRYIKTMATLEADTGRPGAMAATEKIMDALKLCNRRMARMLSMAADNEVMYQKLNEQLVAEVRQQAAIVAELLSCGSTAKQEQAEFDRRYCQDEANHQTATQRKAVLARYLRSKTAILESHRSVIPLYRIRARDFFRTHIPPNPSLYLVTSIMLLLFFYSFTCIG